MIRLLASPPHKELVSKIDSLKSLIDSSLNTQQVQSEQLDSVGSVTMRLADEHVCLYGQIDSLQMQIQTVTEYGIGYSDTLRHIAIPLIIALFAFAFTYLFSVITRINEKYNSEHISGMFKTCLAYRFYMWGSAISVLYIIMMGALSIVLKGTAHLVFMAFMNWSCIIIAGAYAGIILWFVRTCLAYDDNKKIIGIIEQRFLRDKKNNKALAVRTERMIDLCRYADSKQNTELMETVLNRVNELDKAERNDKRLGIGFYTMRFYESMVDSFIQKPHDSETERNLLWNWSRAFRHDNLPVAATYYRMLGKMVESVKRGRFSLFDAFMENCKLRYDFINQVPQVRYAVGDDIEEQKRVCAEGQEMWRELKNVHYMAAAYLFSIGHYEVAGVLKKGAGSGNHSFFPTTTAQILMQYANCKVYQDNRTGSFYRMSMSIDKVIGHKYDRDLLERFTSILLLLAVGSDEEEEYIVDKNKRNLIENAKEAFVKYGHIWTKHTELLNRYPSIRDKKIEEQINEAMKRFTNGELPIDEPKKGRKNKNNTRTIFDYKLTSQDEAPLKELFNKILYDDPGSITDGLNGDWMDNKKDEIKFGTYTFLTSKHIVLNRDIWHHPSVNTDMTQVFKTRFLYILYEILSQMRIREVSVKLDDFEKLFIKEVGDKGKQYAIIDTDSYIEGLLEMDKLPEGQLWSMHRYYQGAYFYNAGVGTMNYLRDVPMAEAYDNTVVLVKFSDLPVLLTTAEDGKPSISISEEPDREKGWASVRVTIDPCLVAKFNKKAEVIKVKFTKR